MTDQELRKLKRTELLELLLEQAKETEALREELRAAQLQLADRRLRLESAGSLAEAALEMNGVFERAEAAAAEYLENIRAMSAEQDAICKKREEKSCEMVLKTWEVCRRMEQEAKQRCEKMMQDAEADVRALWAEFSAETGVGVRRLRAQRTQLHTDAGEDT